MLTGDKIETAKCIAISTGLKDKKNEIFEIANVTTDASIKEALNELDGKISKTMLLIDGGSLSVVLSNKSLEERFFMISKDAPSVCICRCSPT
jgi:phospholipid-translocating ATPase